MCDDGHDASRSHFTYSHRAVGRDIHPRKLDEDVVSSCETDAGIVEEGRRDIEHELDTAFEPETGELERHEG
jgi:hypothetical protein